ncbi:MAG: hypothetical protein R3F26_04310 [Gammaproteobacteria bacterium]
MSESIFTLTHFAIQATFNLQRIRVDTGERFRTHRDEGFAAFGAGPLQVRTLPVRGHCRRCRR